MKSVFSAMATIIPAGRGQPRRDQINGVSVITMSILDENKVCGHECQEYDEDGKLMKIATYNNVGSPHGDVKEFYKNGVVKRHIQYINGVMQGKFLTFYPDGSQRIVATFQNGGCHGDYDEFNPDGQKIKHCHYNEGVHAKGQCHSWDEDGNPDDWYRLCKKNPLD